MKIFIGLMEIAGYYANLKRGFEALGVPATFVNLEYHPFGYGGDDVPNLIVQFARAVSRRRSRTPRAPRSRWLMKAFWKTLEIVLRVPLFIWAAATHDVFIFSGNVSFFFFYDLPILHLLGKRIIYIFHGSESRPPYIDGAVMGADRGVTVEQCIRLTRARKSVLQKIERYADVIVSHPYYGQFHERPFVHFVAVGFPYQPQTQVEPQPPITHNVVRIIHSPSHPEGKGTYRFREIIENLRAKGHAIEFIEITGKPNHEVLRELTQCDFVVDQLYSDLFLSGFGTEGAYFGRAVVIGGHGLVYDRQTFPFDFAPPVAFALPDEIEAVIEKLVMDVDYRQRIGQGAQEFVRRQWTAVAVAQNFMRLIAGDIPSEWVCDPGEIRYLFGYGFPKTRLRELIRAVIQQGGSAALQLADKPHLERAYIEFAHSTD
jgi:hypothetical protein